MAETDTTGAGKTLDFLLAWWDRWFPKEPLDTIEWAKVLGEFYVHEHSILSHLRRTAVSPYPFLEKKISAVIARQESLLKLLDEHLKELGGAAPEGILPESEPAGVPISFDLHEIHDMYNAYVYHHSVVENDFLKSLMSRLISEKKWQEEQLSEIATKIHT